MRVEPELRKQLEEVLEAGETLSSFVETSVRERVRHRLAQVEFVRRGLASLEAARRSGKYIEADAVVAKLHTRLERAETEGRRRRTRKRRAIASF